MTVDEVAIALGMSKQGVRKAIARRRLAAHLVPHGRHGSYYVIDEREVDRYRDASRKPRKATS